MKRQRADLVITNDAGVDGLQHEVQRIVAGSPNCRVQ